MTGRAGAPLRIVAVVGARPNFMKIAPLLAACRREPGIEALLVHTGQHYDDAMNDVFFRDLGIPLPDINLGVGSGSHAQQTADILRAFEPVLLEHRPHCVVVVGDVNSTIACSLAAAKLGIAVAHVEAGLRSGDRAMPEEINRVLTDAISDLLFCTEQSGVDNLRREGVAADKVFLVGNVMADTLLAHRARAAESNVLQRLGVEPGGYAALTLHRPSNVDDGAVLEGIVDALEAAQRELPLVAPMHPRLRAGLEAHGLAQRFDALPGIHRSAPLGYLDFLKLMGDARVVLTDSGGIQEETAILGVPCLTLRRNTERPATLDCGTNRLVGTDAGRIVAAFREALAAPPSASASAQRRTPPLWDGRSAERIVSILLRRGAAPGAAAA